MGWVMTLCSTPCKSFVWHESWWKKVSMKLMKLCLLRCKEKLLFRGWKKTIYFCSISIVKVFESVVDLSRCFFGVVHVQIEVLDNEWVICSGNYTADEHWRSSGNSNWHLMEHNQNVGWIRNSEDEDKVVKALANILCKLNCEVSRVTLINSTKMFTVLVSIAASCHLNYATSFFPYCAHLF